MTTLWLLYLYKHRNNDSILENKIEINQNEKDWIREKIWDPKTQKGQMCQQNVNAGNIKYFDHDRLSITDTVAISLRRNM